MYTIRPKGDAELGHQDVIYHVSTVQLRIDSLLWKAAQLDTIPVDPLTSRRLQGDNQTDTSVNKFFKEFYQKGARQIQTMEGREHTGQVSNKDRQTREEKFRQGKLAALFCSPTNANLLLLKLLMGHHYLN